MSTLDLALEVRFPGFRLAVAAELVLGGISAVMGASGSGKSTLLRALAGLEPAARGHLTLDGECIQDDAAGVRVPAHRRGMGYVFQDARLFAHRSVLGNLRYAAARAPADAPAVGFDDVVETLELGPLLGRRTPGLSAGERQRVAIARALLARPRLLLMDEPLAALDLRRKAQLLPYIARLPQVFGIPVLYVSHAVEEVAQLAGEVLVLAHGEVVARGEVHDVLERPEAEAVSGHFEAGVLLDARVVAQVPEYALTETEVAGQRLRMPAVAAAPGQVLRLRVRARDVALALAPPSGISIRNVLAGRVLRVVPEAEGPYAEVVLDLGGPHLRARITREAAHALALAAGQRVYALIKSVSFDRRALPV